MDNDFIGIAADTFFFCMSLLVANYLTYLIIGPLVGVDLDTKGATAALT